MFLLVTGSPSGTPTGERSIRNGMQRLLANADRVRDDLRGYVVEHLGVQLAYNVRHPWGELAW